MSADSAESDEQVCGVSVPVPGSDGWDPGLHNRKILTFDVGYYRILCEKISVECERCGNTDKREKRKQTLMH